MEDPIYKLEGVVLEQNQEELQDFEGPLDLILFLLSKNKIEIQNIPIALILDQYLAFLNQRKQLDLEIASDFITMASRLMFIKTRMLLSIEDEEAKLEKADLEQSLEERREEQNRKAFYRRIKLATKVMGIKGEFGRNIVTRGPESVKQGKVYVYDHDRMDLLRGWQLIAERVERMGTPGTAAFEQIVQREPYPVENKTKEIIQILKRFGVTRFSFLFRGSRSRSEIVATFIAVLELCKTKMVRLSEADTECTLTYEEGAPDTLTL